LAQVYAFATLAERPEEPYSSRSTELQSQSRAQAKVMMMPQVEPHHSRSELAGQGQVKAKEWVA